MAEYDLPGFVGARLAEACRLPIDRLEPDTPLLELDLDSLTLVAVLTQVEAAYGLELTADDLLGALEAPTLADLTDLLDAALAREPRREAGHRSRVHHKNET